MDDPAAAATAANANGAMPSRAAATGRIGHIDHAMAVVTTAGAAPIAARTVPLLLRRAGTVAPLAGGGETKTAKNPRTRHAQRPGVSGTLGTAVDGIVVVVGTRDVVGVGERSEGRVTVRHARAETGIDDAIECAQAPGLAAKLARCCHSTASGSRMKKRLLPVTLWRCCVSCASTCRRSSRSLSTCSTMHAPVTSSPRLRILNKPSRPLHRQLQRSPHQRLLPRLWRSNMPLRLQERRSCQGLRLRPTPPQQQLHNHHPHRRRRRRHPLPSRLRHSSCMAALRLLRLLRRARRHSHSPLPLPHPPPTLHPRRRRPCHLPRRGPVSIAPTSPAHPR